MIATVAVLALALQSPGALKPAATGDIVGATRACIAASDPRQVDTAQLAAEGWQAGATQDGRGKPVETDLDVWASAGNGAVILTMAGQPLCTVMARVERAGRYPVIRDALHAAIGARGRIVERQAYQQTWMVEGLVIDLAATGNQQAPSVRVTVMQTKGNS